MKKNFLLLLFCVLSFNVIHAEVTWTLSNDGTLTISGTDMPDYGDEDDMGSTAPWYSKVTKIKKVVIKNGVTNIGANAFPVCSALTSVIIPNSVTSIGSYAFDKTKWYENQPDGLVYAGLVLYIYKGTMPANTNVEIKEGTKGIAEEAFMNCSGLTSITIPNSVTSIGKNAFRNCGRIRSITCEANTPPSCISSIDSYDKNIPVYVPANSVDAYKEADVWKDFTNIQAITNTGVKEIQAANNKYVIYDMNGRMVNEKNLKPGMYVKNGKKLVIK